MVPPYTGNDWTLAVYISSVEKIKQVVAITAVILIIIGIIVLWLMRKES